MVSMARHTLDVRALALAVEAVMASRGLSVADLAGETDLSTRSIRHMLDGGMPRANTLLTLLIWLRLPPERVATDTMERSTTAPPHPQPPRPSAPVVPGDEDPGA